MIRYFIFAAMIFFPVCSLYGEEDRRTESHEFSIFDEDRSSWSYILTKLVTSNNWLGASDETRHVGVCKRYAHEIHINEAMNVLGFKLEDMVSIPEDEKYKYDQNSGYWYSCNCIYPSDPDVPKYLSWYDAEYVMKGPFFVVFVKYVDRDKGVVRVVVVEKYEQMIANRANQETWWDSLVNLIHVLIYSHPMVKNYEFYEDELDGKAE